METAIPDRLVLGGHSFIEQLGNTAMNCYRLRHFGAGEARKLTNSPN